MSDQEYWVEYSSAQNEKNIALLYKVRRSESESSNCGSDSEMAAESFRSRKVHISSPVQCFLPVNESRSFEEVKILKGMFQNKTSETNDIDFVDSCNKSNSYATSGNKRKHEYFSSSPCIDSSVEIISNSTHYATNFNEKGTVLSNEATMKANEKHQNFEDERRKLMCAHKFQKTRNKSLEKLQERKIIIIDDSTDIPNEGKDNSVLAPSTKNSKKARIEVDAKAFSTESSEEGKKNACFFDHNSKNSFNAKLQNFPYTGSTKSLMSSLIKEECNKTSTISSEVFKIKHNKFSQKVSSSNEGSHANTVDTESHRIENLTETRYETKKNVGKIESTLGKNLHAETPNIAFIRESESLKSFSKEDGSEKIPRNPSDVLKVGISKATPIASLPKKQATLKLAEGVFEDENCGNYKFRAISERNSSSITIPRLDNHHPEKNRAMSNTDSKSITRVGHQEKITSSSRKCDEMLVIEKNKIDHCSNTCQNNKTDKSNLNLIQQTRSAVIYSRPSTDTLRSSTSQVSELTNMRRQNQTAKGSGDHNTNATAECKPIKIIKKNLHREFVYCESHSTPIISKETEKVIEIDDVQVKNTLQPNVNQVIDIDSATEAGEDSDVSVDWDSFDTNIKEEFSRKDHCPAKINWDKIDTKIKSQANSKMSFKPQKQNLQGDFEVFVKASLAPAPKKRFKPRVKKHTSATVVPNANSKNKTSDTYFPKLMDFAKVDLTAQRDDAKKMDSGDSENTITQDTNVIDVDQNEEADVLSNSNQPETERVKKGKRHITEKRRMHPKPLNGDDFNRIKLNVIIDDRAKLRAHEIMENEARKKHFEQERLLRQSANRLKLNINQLGKTYIGQSFSSPVRVEELPKDHWKWPDLYARLGLPKNASEKVIRAQYRKLALRYHPDKSNSMDSLRPFQAVKEAYEMLCN